MFRRLLVSLSIVLIALTLTVSAAAQSYYFQLEQEIVHVYWNSDGSLAIDYTFVFKNEVGAHTIDFVDVGMPNGNYDYDSISADVDGHPVTTSRDYKGEGSYGFAVDLGAYAIQPGQRGTVHVYVGRISRVLYPDDDDANYASAVFSPTWFGSQYVYGTTDMTVVFHLPPGVLPEEPRYHIPGGGWPGTDQPEAAFDNEGRITYTWRSTAANGYSQYTFGASFPRQYVPDSAIVTPSAFSIDFDALLGICCVGSFFLLFFGLPILGIINERKRKIQYMPPKISIEGHGIKRGLTAVEAAILMEQPLDKVMTMILFSVIKKGAATVARRDPLELQVTQPQPEELHEYETNFLKAFAEPNLAARRRGLQEMTVNLVKSVSDKIKGFSRKETTEYYKSIMERAWTQVEAENTPEVKSQKFDENLEWTMLDRNYDDRTRRVFTGPIFVPFWWHHYDPAYRPVTGTPKVASVTPATSSGRASPPSVPGAAFAASVVNGVQNFSSRVIGDLTGFTSKVTQQTNPMPKPSSSGWKSSGGGGRSCACACACAGCACACAGGGR